MVERMIKKLVDAFQENGLILQSDYDKYVYVLSGDVEFLITLTSIFLLSILIGQVLPTIGFLICFLVLRRRTGGYHMDTYFQCYFCTLCVYILVTILTYVMARYTWLLIGTAFLAGIVIMIIGSVNHPNMDMGQEELQDSKAMARIIVCIELASILFLKWLGDNEILISYACLAVILCAILLIVAKIVGQEVKEE